MIALAALLFAVLQPVPPSPSSAAGPSAAPTASMTGAPASPGASAPAAAPSPATTSTSAASPAATVSPAAAPTVQPSAGPSGPVTSGTPAATATPEAYDYRFVPRQPDHPAAGQPQIFAVYLNSKKLKSLGPIDIKVATTPNAVKVLTRSNGREGTVPMIAPGDFEAKSKLPKLPFIASGISTTLEFIAVGADGQRVSVSVPVILQ